MRGKNKSFKITLLLISFIILVIVGISIYSKMMKPTKPVSSEPKITNVKLENKEEVKTEKESKETSQNSSEPVIENNDKEEKNSSSSTNNSTTANDSKPKQQTTTSVSIPKVQEQPQAQIETPKETTAWEKLGISEYDYYNSPVQSWKTVEFKVSDYGNRQAAFEACQNYGKNYTGLENYSFRCDSVESYSGDYLGEHIKITELTS